LPVEPVEPVQGFGAIFNISSAFDFLLLRPLIEAGKTIEPVDGSADLVS
jgi:hypothetical protein